MAETGGTTPRYTLDSGTLDAVREAGVGGKQANRARKRLRKADMTGAITDAAKEVGAGIALGKAVKDQREEARKKEEEEKKRIRDNAEATFNEGMSKITKMGWADEGMYQQFIEIEKAEKEKYLQAIEDGDKELAAKLLRQQQQRATELNALKGSMTTAADVNGGYGGGWSNKIKNDTNMQTDLGLLASLDPEKGTTWEYEVDEYGVPEMVVTIVAEDGRFADDAAAEKAGYEKNDEGKYEKKYKKSEVDQIVADGIAPMEVKKKYRESLANYKQTSKEGKTSYDWETIAVNNAESLTAKDITTFLHEPVFGENRTFVDDFISNDNFVWQAPIKVKGNKALEDLEASLPGGNPDGTIDEEEWKLLLNAEEGKDDETIKETRRLIAMEMENQPDIARQYIGDFITRMQKQNVASEEEGEKKNNNQQVTV